MNISDYVKNDAAYLSDMNGAEDYKKKIADYAVGERMLDIGAGGGVMLDLLTDQHPEAEVIGIDLSAILAFHEFLFVSGSRSPIGEKIFEQIIKRNPNVIAVLSGHYHSSNLKVDKLDDNGDGKPDRKVYQMLADYQGGPEGGQGYLRILHVDPKHDTIHVKTYSPYLDDYNFYDPHQFGPKGPAERMGAEGPVVSVYIRDPDGNLVEIS